MHTHARTHTHTHTHLEATDSVFDVLTEVVVHALPNKEIQIDRSAKQLHVTLKKEREKKQQGMSEVSMSRLVILTTIN